MEDEDALPVRVRPSLSELAAHEDEATRDAAGGHVVRHLAVPGLKGSIGEGSNFSHQSSIKILSKFSTFC